MTFDEYQEGVSNTWRYDIPRFEQEQNAIYGIMGELGELVELHKKHYFHGIAIDYVKERKELGDLLYYITALINIRTYSIESIAKENHDKLKVRYPNGFTEGGGIR